MRKLLNVNINHICMFMYLQLNKHTFKQKLYLRNILINSKNTRVFDIKYSYNVQFNLYLKHKYSEKYRIFYLMKMFTIKED